MFLNKQNLFKNLKKKVWENQYKIITFTIETNVKIMANRIKLCAILSANTFQKHENYIEN